jgi:hypothetical protein
MQNIVYIKIQNSIRAYSTHSAIDLAEACLYGYGRVLNGKVSNVPDNAHIYDFQAWADSDNYKESFSNFISEMKELHK